jgi:hypothetical protein
LKRFGIEIWAVLTPSGPINASVNVKDFESARHLFEVKEANLQLTLPKPKKSA